MFRRIATTFVAAVVLCCAFVTAQAATLSPNLTNQINKLANTANVGVVIIAFNTTNGLNSSHLLALTSVGITKGITFQQSEWLPRPQQSRR